MQILNLARFNKCLNEQTTQTDNNGTCYLKTVPNNQHRTIFAPLITKKSLHTTFIMEEIIESTNDDGKTKWDT